MSILAGILQFVLVIVCILLVGVILLQRNKGAGAGVTFGGGEAVFGADMGNVLTRSTIVLGVLFIAITITLSIINARIRGNGPGSVTDGVSSAPVLPAAVAEEPAQAEDAVAAVADAANEAADEVAAGAADAANEAADAVADAAKETADVATNAADATADAAADAAKDVSTEAVQAAEKAAAEVAE